MSSKDRRYFVGELLTIILVVAVYIWWGLYHGQFFTKIADSQLAITVTALLASLFGSLLGFILAIAIFLLGVIEGKSFALLRASKSYPELWNIFKGALVSSGAATFAGLSATFLLWIGLFDNWMISVLIGLSVWSMLKISRVVWVLCKVIDAEVFAGAASRSSIISEE